MRVHCITTGAARPKLRERGVRRYLPGSWSPTALPVHAFLIEHPAGLCLFDAGQTAAAAWPGHLPRWHPFLRLTRFELTPGDEVAPQLDALGFAPVDVRWAALSHLHTDHAGGITPFAAADILVSRNEWRRAGGLGGRLRGYLPQHWPASARPRLVDFTDGPIGPFPASHDVAGDGMLMLVPTPGHTPGHMSMLARDGERRYLLCGDLVHTPRELPGAAPEIDRYCREAGVVPLATHDPRAAEAIAAS